MTKKSSSKARALRIAVVGTGGVAQRNYLPFLAAQPDVAIACYNRTPEKAEQAAREFGGQAFRTLKELVAWKPTAALVLTTETCRHEVGAELIERGVPRVFFEKPLVAVNGQAYSREVLKEAIAAARTGTAPIQLLLKFQGSLQTVAVDYHGGLQYPHLERIAGKPDYLDQIIAARK